MLALCRLTGKQGPTGAAPKWRWLSITLSKEPWFCPFSAGLVLLAALFWPWKIPPHSQPLYFDDGHHRLLCGSPWIYKFINYLTFSGMQYSVRTYPFFPLDYWSVIKTEPCISAMLQNLYVFSNLCVYLFQENCGSDFFWKLFFMDFLSILLKSLWKNGSRSLRGGPCPFSGLRSGGCWRIFSIKLLNTHLWGRLQPQTSWLSSREFGSVSSPFRVNFLMVSIF